MTPLLIILQLVNLSQLLNSRKTLNETYTDMIKVKDNVWVISMTVIEITRIKNLNLKEIKMISMKAFVLSLTFLVKLYFSLSISFLTLITVKFSFLLQTAQFRVSFKASFLLIFWIRTFHLMIISSDLLIQLWFHCRSLLTINNCCCSLQQKI